MVDSSVNGSTMVSIDSTTDFEFYSSTSKGAIQGNGYEFHSSRLLPLI